MPQDKFSDEADVVWAQATRWAAIAPSDTADLTALPKAIRCNGGGSIVLVGDDGVSVGFTVADGETLACRPVRIRATGTTATGIVALY